MGDVVGRGLIAALSLPDFPPPPGSGNSERRLNRGGTIDTLYLAKDIVIQHDEADEISQSLGWVSEELPQCPSFGI